MADRAAGALLGRDTQIEVLNGLPGSARGRDLQAVLGEFRSAEPG